MECNGIAYLIIISSFDLACCLLFVLFCILPFLNLPTRPLVASTAGGWVQRFFWDVSPFLQISNAYTDDPRTTIHDRHFPRTGVDDEDDHTTPITRKYITSRYASYVVDRTVGYITPPPPQNPSTPNSSRRGPARSLSPHY